MKPLIIAAWWESGDQAMQNWRNERSASSRPSTPAASRSLAEARALPIIQVFGRASRATSPGFGVLKDAPHPKAAQGIRRLFLRGRAGAGEPGPRPTTSTTTHPTRRRSSSAQGVDDATRATNPENWNAMLFFDVVVLKDQLPIIQKRWQDWIAK